jgi:hypothetical protein
MRQILENRSMENTHDDRIMTKVNQSTAFWLLVYMKRANIDKKRAAKQPIPYDQCIPVSLNARSPLVWPLPSCLIVTAIRSSCSNMYAICSADAEAALESSCFLLLAFTAESTIVSD